MQLSMAGGDQIAGVGGVPSVNKKFLKTRSLLIVDATGPLDPIGMTAWTQPYDERTTLWALNEAHRQHAHNPPRSAPVYAGMLHPSFNPKAHSSRAAPHTHSELGRDAHDVYE